MKTGIFVLSLFFVVWCFLSTRWYVCGIKKLCESSEEIVPTLVADDLNEEQQPPTAGSDQPIQFAWSDSELIINEDLSHWKDSIFGLFEEIGSGKLVLSGLYYPKEENSSGDDNLGLARARAVAEWLMEQGFNSPIDLRSSLKKEDVATTTQKIGIEFEIIENEQPSLPDQVTRAKPDPVKPVEEARRAKPTESKGTSQNKFFFSSSTLADEALLERQVSDLVNKSRPIKGNLLIVGHSAKSGNELADKKTGLKLASKVSELLANQGIDETKVLTESAGSDQARGGRHSNRVEIIIQ